MESADNTFFALIGAVNSGVGFLAALAVLVLGLAVVRPLHATAGLVFAGAGGARIAGIGLSWLLSLARPKDADIDVVMVFIALDTLLWLVTAAIFWGGVAFGAVQLASAKAKAGVA